MWLMGRLQGGGICKAVTFHVNRDSFLADFYTIPLENCGACVRVNWLRILGPILWDFNSLTMTFSSHEKELKVWQGQPVPKGPRLEMPHAYPEFELEGKLKVQGGSDVTDAFVGKH